MDFEKLALFKKTHVYRWRDRFAPRHRGCGLTSAFCPALRAGHQAAAADGRPREPARASARR